MPKFVRIPSDAPVPSVPTEDSLRSAVADAAAEVERLRAWQADARDSLSRSEWSKVKAETDEAFIAAIDALNAAEKALGRFLGSQPGQVVEVGAATEVAS